MASMMGRYVLEGVIRVGYRRVLWTRANRESGARYDTGMEYWAFVCLERDEVSCRCVTYLAQ